MQKAVVVARTKFNRAYRRNLTLAAVCAGGCGFARAMLSLPQVVNPGAWRAGFGVCLILALLFTLRALHLRRELSAQSRAVTTSRGNALGPALYQVTRALADVAMKLPPEFRVFGLGLVLLDCGGLLVSWFWDSAHWTLLGVLSIDLVIIGFAVAGRGVALLAEVTGLDEFFATLGEQPSVPPFVNPVHGDARSAREWEAWAAARGKGEGSPFNHQTFED
jgi:hypothetical protein